MNVINVIYIHTPKRGPGYKMQMTQSSKELHLVGGTSASIDIERDVRSARASYQLDPFGYKLAELEAVATKPGFSVVLDVLWYQDGEPVPGDVNDEMINEFTKILDSILEQTEK